MTRITDRAHDAVRSALQPGETAIDGTAGNGHDTRFLRECVGPAGCVFAFDVQLASQEAVGHEPSVRFFLCDHAEMAERIPAEFHGKIAAAMFNLGYLPRSDHRITTQPESSGRAILAAARLLRVGGVLTVVAYRGHPGGEEETETVRSVFRALGETGFDVEEHASASGVRPGPVLFLARKN